MSNDAATSEQVREPSRELAEDELAQVSGGIIAILIGGLSAPIRAAGARDDQTGPPGLTEKSR